MRTDSLHAVVERPHRLGDASPRRTKTPNCSRLRRRPTGLRRATALSFSPSLPRVRLTLSRTAYEVVTDRSSLCSRQGRTDARVPGPGSELDVRSPLQRHQRHLGRRDGQSFRSSLQCGRCSLRLILYRVSARRSRPSPSSATSNSFAASTARILSSCRSRRWITGPARSTAGSLASRPSS